MGKGVVMQIRVDVARKSEYERLAESSGMSLSAWVLFQCDRVVELPAPLEGGESSAKLIGSKKSRRVAASVPASVDGLVAAGVVVRGSDVPERGVAPAGACDRLGRRYTGEKVFKFGHWNYEVVDSGGRCSWTGESP